MRWKLWRILFCRQWRHFLVERIQDHFWTQLSIFSNKKETIWCMLPTRAFSPLELTTQNYMLKLLTFLEFLSLRTSFFLITCNFLSLCFHKWYSKISICNAKREKNYNDFLDSPIGSFLGLLEEHLTNLLKQLIALIARL